MASSGSLASAVGSGDCKSVRLLLESGTDPNRLSPEGMTPLAVASFWGYDQMVQLLLQHGADVNAPNRGTLWTPLHCASFQGHGPVVMLLLEQSPDLYSLDVQGRTAVDFASAHETIWPFFAALGCERRSPADLLRMGIVQKTPIDDCILHHLERGDIVQAGQGKQRLISVGTRQVSTLAGDVLASCNEGGTDSKSNKPSLDFWNH